MLVQLNDRGGMTEDARNALKRRLQDLAGQKVTVDIKPYTPSRSLAQNRLFHKWVTEIAVAIDAPKDATKEWLKKRYLGQDAHTIGREVVVVTKSTSKLKVGEFADFLTQIEQWCAEVGIEITQPVDYRLAMYGEVA